MECKLHIPLVNTNKGQQCHYWNSTRCLRSGKFQKGVKQCSNYHTIAFISHTSNNAQNFPIRLQQYMNHENPDVLVGFIKGRGARGQFANIHWLIEKAREFQKNIKFCFIDYAKVFDCVDHNKLWKILKEMGMPHHLTCLLRNLYPDQEATIRTEYGTDWFQIGKGVCQGCILSPCLFNLYAEYIMRKAGLDEAQAGIKISGRNINTLRFSDDKTLMAESEKELTSLLMKVKEESKKLGLKLNIQKINIMAPGPITPWKIDGDTVETVAEFILGSSKNHCRWWLQPWNEKILLPLKKRNFWTFELWRKVLLKGKLWPT